MGVGFHQRIAGFLAVLAILAAVPSDGQELTELRQELEGRRWSIGGLVE